MNQLEIWQAMSESVSLIPLKGKVPLEKGWERWCQEKRPFTPKDFLHHNAGVACGPASNRLVVDVDCPSLFKLTCLRKGWAVPDTETVLTGSGNCGKRYHLYFSYPGGNGREYGNKSLKRWGFDVRGIGGQVVAPGSIHPDTHQPYRIKSGGALCPPPKWLLDLYEEPRQEQPPPQTGHKRWDGDIDRLPVKPETKDLIRQGVAKGERSEAVIRVVNALVWSNLSDAEIFSIFEQYPIGEKFQEKRRVKEKWLQGEISRARVYVGADRAEEPRLHVVKPGKPKPQHKKFNLTDLGNAERFARDHIGKVKFCHPWGSWFAYTGKFWERDTSGTIKRRAKTTVRGIYKEASAISDDKEREKVVSHAIRSETKSRVQAMIDLANSEPGIPVELEDLDTNPILLNCLNGTLDLKTGELLSHNPDNLITKIVPVKYDKDALCPLWESFLDRVLAENQDLIEYVQRVIGYCLTGITTEHALFFLYGHGANGKSTFVDVVRSLVGDYAKQVDFSTFLLQKYESVRNDLAMLRGARIVSAVEVDSGKRLAEVIVKHLTGGDTVAARFLYHEYFEFKPEFKILLAANHKPLIYGTDYAIWRRIRLIPFTVTIPEEEQDPNLAETLKLELPGILTWAVQGCLQWRQKRLGIPEAVREATEEYRSEMDVLGPFLETCCEFGPRKEVKNKDFYTQYESWCEQESEKPISKRAISLRLKERGFIQKRTGRDRIWVGIGLTDCDS